MRSLSLVFSLCVFAVTAVASGATKSAPRPVVGYRANAERTAGESERVYVGSSRGEVRLLLGDPDVRVGVGENECWIFWDFRARPADANPQGYDTLVLSFTGDVVGAMKLADGYAIRLLLAQQKLASRR